MNTNAMKAAQDLRSALDSRYSFKRRLSIASITSVTKDAAGHVISAVGVVDGLANVSIGVGFNAAVAKNVQVVVEDRGTVMKPDWHMAAALGGGVTVVGYFGSPGGSPFVTPAGLVLGEGNLFRNGDFSQTHRLHLNQPIGWVTNAQTQIVGELGET